jgi:hypothetical protein
MEHAMKNLLICKIIVVAALLISVQAVLSAERGKVDFVLVNDSDWEIHHLYLSPADEEAWGPDQLGDDALKRAESLTLKGVPCDGYDFRIVDKGGRECVIPEVYVCKDKSGLGITKWRITNKELTGC